MFKDFAAYAKTLDVEHDRETVVSNLKVMRAKVGDLLDSIEKAESQLVKAAELEAEMRDIEEKLNIPAGQRWDGRRGENRFEAQYDDDDDGIEFQDEGELEETEDDDVQGGAHDSVPHTLEDGTTGLEGADDGEQIAEGAAQG